MWGYISTEASYQLNFNVGFSTTRSDILIHLAQWQYWWWFWFTFLWVFYYLFSSKIVRFRTLKMRPKMSTSFRPHGKWGDFLAAVIPAIWCLNILANSNFILRLIEWQNESSLFTVRVRARQWYWIYKFELKNLTDILSAPKNIGHNKWCINTFGDLQIAEDYLYLIQLRSQNKWIKNYWSEILQKTGDVKQNNIVSAQEQLRLDLVKKQYNSINNNLLLNGYNLLNINNILINKEFYINSNSFINFFNRLLNKKKFWEHSELSSNIFQKIILPYNDFFNFNAKKTKIAEKYVYNILLKAEYADKINTYTDNISESSRLIKRTQGVELPLRIVKPILEPSQNHNINLLNTIFNSNEVSIKHKQIPHSSYFSIKQKRYNKKSSIPLINKNLPNKQKYSGKPILFDNLIFNKNIEDPIILYNLIKKNKKRTELIPVNLAKRILRTKKTLVLPAHINITIITNSFDIVHSWFIPGLGIKLDCVPGRSTHHTFYIDNVGFYYGQCAEICGRFHHHMPIRVCALPFEHFLVWWYNFGLPKLIFTQSQKRYESYYAFRKYVW